MLTGDTSALVSLAAADVLELALAEFEVHTTATVVTELENTAEYDDAHGTAARTVLDHCEELAVHTVDNSAFESSRIDAGEGSCVHLTEELAADFLVTDDLRALPELQVLTDAHVAISPIVLKALVNRDALASDTAVDQLEQLAASRDWLGRPIYRRARRYFE